MKSKYYNLKKQFILYFCLIFNINFSISPSATHSKYSTPGIRSLPLTPPGLHLLDVGRPSVALSCPDGLAHALSEQNLRLQQIVYEHKVILSRRKCSL